MYFETKTVTPDQAQQWLDRYNTGNRPVRKQWVKELAADMRTGKFYQTHQGIAFSRDRLIDGQHRLLAVIESGVTVPMTVAWEANPATYLVVDQGAKKTSADIFGSTSFVMEVVRLAAKVCENAIRATAVEKYLPILPYAQMLADRSGTARRFLSSAPVRLAAVARILEGEDIEYVLSLYENLVNANINALPPIGAALVSYVLKNNQGAVQSVNSRLSKGMIVFTQANAENTKFSVKDESRYVARVRVAIQQKIRS